MIRTLSPSPIGFNGMTTSVGGPAAAIACDGGAASRIGSACRPLDHHHPLAPTAITAASSPMYQSTADDVRGARATALPSLPAGADAEEGRASAARRSKR
jgi:hypothetical protein